VKVDSSVTALFSGTDGSDLTYKALNAIDAGKLVSAKERVLVKPNITIMKPASEGVTTDTGVVEGVIRFLKDQGVCEIAIGEGGGCDITEAYADLGFVDVASRYNVKLIDLNLQEGVLMKVPQSSFLSHFWIAKPILDYDCIVSAAKLKIHAGEWKVTLSMKNMMGVLARGERRGIHYEDRGIVDLLQVAKPSLAVIDGLVGGQSHELRSDPVRMNLVIAGGDFVAADVVGAAVMGFSPDELPRHIRLASEKGFGAHDLRRIRLVGGVAISDVRKRFRRTE